MESVFKILSLLAFSAVKFLFAVPTVSLAGYSFFETILITCSGGLAGFFAFYYLGEVQWIRYYVGLIFDKILMFFGYDANKKVKKKFSRKNRLIINVKKKYGIIGLSLLTPVLFSIPLGSLIAARYFDDDNSTIPWMTGSIVFWSFVLTIFSKLF